MPNRPSEARDAVLLGADLASLLGARVGDVVDVLSRETTSTLVGIVPRRRFFEVVGIFRFGFYEVDHTQAFISLTSAQDFLNRTGPDLMQVRLANLDEAPRIREAVEELLGPGAKVVDWTELNQPLYAALWLEKVAISLTIGLIVMVAALNIVASLVLLVMEKTRDIAILRTLGAPAVIIRRIFILQGLAIGLIGTAAGTVLGARRVLFRRPIPVGLPASGCLPDLVSPVSRRALGMWRLSSSRRLPCALSRRSIHRGRPAVSIRPKH